jgi:Fic family protein
MFADSPTGSLVPIHGIDPQRGEWKHVAFLPNPLPNESPTLSVGTQIAVADARAALAMLGARASLLPNPRLLRRPTLRVEAQSTSALEGTYATLEAVLSADEEEEQTDDTMREIVNYILAADQAFKWIADQRPLALGFIESLQGRLVQKTSADTDQAGKVRTCQVAIGARRSGRIEDARFVPPPPGPELEALTRDCVLWISEDHRRTIDPVVAAAMAHYQFETLHPFNDGNGRIGRLAIVLHMLITGALTEPTLSVSRWFEQRRPEYYDLLRAVSATGDWDAWIRFFADGVADSALTTETLLRRLISVQSLLKERVRDAGLRADTAYSLVEFAVGQSIFTVRQVERKLGVSYPRANKLVQQLIDANVLRQYDDSTYARRFAAPDVLAILRDTG